MSVTNQEDSGTGNCIDSWSTPPAQGGITHDGERYRIRWWPASGTTKIALFNIATDDSVAVLLHVRSVVLQQKGETRTNLDPDASLEAIPDALLAMMQGQGFKPAENGEVTV